MQLLSLRVENFGLYSGTHSFDLTPRVRGGEHRPLTVFVGHNGAGKSTLFTALFVALHGSLALGERVGQAQYNDFLYSRMHRNKGDDRNAVSSEASVALSLEYIQSGTSRRVHIARAWRRNGRIVNETLSVTQDGQLLASEAADAQAWVNDLLPSSMARLCFFDAEDLDALAGADQRNLQLGEAMRRLLGLDLIQRLQGDLRAYALKQGGSSAVVDCRQVVLAHQHELDKLGESLENLTNQEAKLTMQAEGLEALVADQERRLAAAGGLFAARRAARQEQLIHVRSGIEAAKAKTVDMAAHLLPFALAPSLCTRLSNRLTLEAETQRRQVAQSLVREHLARVETTITADEFWTGLQIPRKKQIAIREKLQATLDMQAPDDDDLPPIRHHLAAPERDQLQGWMHEVRDVIPGQAQEIGSGLRLLQDKQREIERDLQRAPEDEELAPLHEQLIGLQAELVDLQQRQAALAQEIIVVQYQRDIKERQMQRDVERLAEAQAEQQEMALAERSRLALRAYEDALTRRRLAELEEALVECFNTLCQKEHLLKSVSIRPDDFQVKLESTDGRELSLGTFSAGERQLYALALLQALRKVSGRPLPLLIDTPLARLDEQHRRRMLHDYLPNASDQIVLFATDAEADAAFLSQAEPYLAHAYRLQFDSIHGATEPMEIKQLADLLPMSNIISETADAL